MAQEILCEVNNCVHWGEGNHCEADRIYVVSNADKITTEQEETDCHTFSPKMH
ncbi:hypothetical protein JCM19037_3570 [Geomicrobium sp. JCM 19037]|uniref:DUF1540 domain-containing protein n=1 Tax=unclassified Geomicrobium TaxID=2628951 RepID=UPI00045F3A97|nr:MULTISPECIES: DUF1540 domain-containing protein [unclassified Geomicrobium]GAK05100.1 hypothetical protein JCM19037_3570 [Geomicrobium sp. JCM 19037]GAK13574.1 hypothetical protein JCM19039_3433 [Geomicrobium sp. JCM 19039]